MGVVYKAEDTQLRRTVALKFLSSQSLGDKQVEARLIREAQASASLDHPNICAVPRNPLGTRRHVYRDGVRRGALPGGQDQGTAPAVR